MNYEEIEFQAQSIGNNILFLFVKLKSLKVVRLKPKFSSDHQSILEQELLTKFGEENKKFQQNPIKFQPYLPALSHYEVNKNQEKNFYKQITGMKEPR